ncbi:MAG TPA: hypothetical protein VH165_15210 [Kofleriaceae bacterium]|nr:hypothetical protein [Kofleriaceae bacterium]
MRAEITDRDAISALTPSALTSYLRARGWEPAAESDTAFAVFERVEGNEKVGLEVPLRAFAGDYGRRVAEVLYNLEIFEQRSQLDIFRDVLHSNQDVVRVSVDVPDSGRMGLDEASTLLAATRDLVLAAACSAHTRRAYFSRRKPQRATEYLRKIRLAAPEAGSFVVVLESPVTALATASTLGDGITDPFERAAVLMLARVGERVRQSISETTATGKLDRFVEGVEVGVNANYCDAIARILEEDDGRNLALDFGWAPSRPILGHAPSHLAFSRGEAEILRAASTFLKERAPIAGFEVLGAVVRLESTTPAAGGNATLAALVDDVIRQVVVTLGADDYRAAMHAHQNELEVSVEGELEREGRTYRLRNPRMFAIVE